MADTLNEPLLQAKISENAVNPVIIIPEKKHTLRRVILAIAVSLFIVLIVALLYLNGKSLYERGI